MNTPFTPALIDAGFHLIPVTPESKTPHGKWKQYQTREPNETELKEWSSSDLWAGIALTSDMEVIDIDDPDLVAPFHEALEHFFPGLIDQTLVVSTPRGGEHIYYFCDKVEGNQKLAMRLVNGKPKTIIETRGPGGYVMAPTTPKYSIKSGRLDDVITIDDSIRDAILEIARSFNELPADDSRQWLTIASGSRISEQWEADTEWEKILPDWTFQFTTRAGVTYVQRPGKDAKEGASATINYIPDRLYVFSSNAPLPANRSYSKFQAWTFLEHDGDFKKAAKALRLLGYVEPPKAELPADDVSWEINGAHIASDLGNSERFVAQHEKNVRYNGSEWFVWTRKLWERNELRAEALAKRTAASIKKELKQYPDSERYEAMAKWAIRSESASKIAAILTLARSHEKLSCDDTIFNANPYDLNCRNGIVDMRTGTLRPHEREAFCTGIVDLDYNPDADSSAWESFLATIMLGDAEMVEYLHHALGYSITGSSAFNALFFCYGQGHNGKTTMIEAIHNLLGSYSAGLHKSTLMSRSNDTSLMPGLAKLVGKRFVSASEVTPGDKLDEGCVKTCTGSDSITCRNLFSKEITFRPSHHIWGMGNEKPVISGQDEGIWRRMHLIPFDHHFANPDTTIKDLFMNDEKTKQGILAWLVRGAAKTIALIEAKQEIHKPHRVVAATAEYRAEMDTIGQWFDEHVEANEYSFIKSSALYQHYHSATLRNGHKPFSVTKFGLYLNKTKKIAKDARRDGNYYVGVKLRDGWI